MVAACAVPGRHVHLDGPMFWPQAEAARAGSDGSFLDDDSLLTLESAGCEAVTPIMASTGEQNIGEELCSGAPRGFQYNAEIPGGLTLAVVSPSSRTI